MNRFGGTRVAELEHERKDLLESLVGCATPGFRLNTLYRGRLSPGCEACGCGLWSCLFLTGRCTASCFFCPQEQKKGDEDGLPETLGLTFQEPEEYVRLLEALAIEAIGISGGEPLLVFEERLIPYLECINNRLNGRAYVWLYSNGDRLSPDKLARMKDHGLSELRINIAARGYDLTPVALALEHLDVVTVEVPVIVEEEDRLQRALVELDALGVRYVNLHQLHQTPNNAAKLQRRGYTLSGPPGAADRGGLVESELAALRLIRVAAEANFELSIHYCPFSFKVAVQRMRASARFARLVCTPIEAVTEAGYVRSVSIFGDPSDLCRSASILNAQGADPGRWRMSDDKTTLALHPSLLRGLDLSRATMRMRYALPTLHHHDGTIRTRRELQLGPTTAIRVEKPVVADIEVRELDEVNVADLVNLFESGNEWSRETGRRPGLDARIAEDLVRRMAPLEWIPEGRYTEIENENRLACALHHEEE